jgi:dTDP-4-amino-4,6-dideoxygalactose transaminase
VEPIPIFKVTPPPLTQVVKYLEKSWGQQQLTNGGPCLKLLESRLAEYFAVPAESVVVAANATLVIQGGVQTCEKNVKPWLVPSWTFPATYLAVHNSGRDYEIVDVDSNGRINLDSRDNPIVEVWPFGTGESNESLSGEGFRVIDAAASFDAAKGIGSRLKLNTALVVSLHATKALAGSEGGVFICKNVEWASRFRAWLNFGFAPGSRTPELVGTNAKMSEGDAAIALAAVDEWQQTREQWLNLSQELVPFMQRLGLEIPPQLLEGRATSYLILETLQIEKDERIMREIGLETRRWWTPAHQGKEKGLSFSQEGRYPNTDRFFQTWLGLPFYLYMDTSLWKERIELFSKLRNENG